MVRRYFAESCQIYEVLHPETKAGAAGGKASGEVRRTKEITSAVQQKFFADDTSEKTTIK